MKKSVFFEYDEDKIKMKYKLDVIKYISISLNISIN